MPLSWSLNKGLVAFLAALWLMLSLASPWANAQPASPAPGGIGSTIKTICPNPGVCFRSQEAKDNWAKEKNCQFLEDVCSKTPASEDNKGAKAEDAGFWGGLWNQVSGALQYGYEFSKGLFTGLISQVTDIIDLISDPLEVAKGLVALGKAFYDDPKGTLATLAELLGQEAVDTIAKATQCGAYDLGKVIGSYVSPAVALKLAAKLGKFSGKIADAVKATKADLGCASFTAGTLIHTPQGLTAIERITRGGAVDSRDESHWHDKTQQVTSTFGRTAPSYRQLQTELETLNLTDEHPLWVQGKGWTQAKDVVQDDVLAALQGDLLVRANTVVAKPVQVFNFSVNNTPNYFVGEAGVWAHNASGVKCNLGMPYKAPKSPSGYKIGASDGGKGAWVEIGRPDDSHFRYEKQVSSSPKNIEYEVGGKKFDGYDAKRDVLLDAKDYTKDNPIVKGTPPFLADKLKADAILDAKAQVAAAGGTKVEWHVSSSEAAAALDNLFKSDPSLVGKIKVVWTPDIVN
jgi:hypothetical protein